MKLRFYMIYGIRNTFSSENKVAIKNKKPQRRHIFGTLFGKNRAEIIILQAVHPNSPNIYIIKRQPERL